MCKDGKCAFLDVVFCRGDEHCQYKMTNACYPLGEKYCGIEVMRSHVKGGMCEECRSAKESSVKVLDWLQDKLDALRIGNFNGVTTELLEEWIAELRTKDREHK